MERPKSSRNQKDIKLKFSCAGARRESTNKTSTSFYEIDIQSYVYKKPKKAIKKKANEEKLERQLEYENPFVQSHYPILMTEETPEEDGDEYEPEESEEEMKELYAVEEPKEEIRELTESDKPDEEISKPKKSKPEKHEKAPDSEKLHKKIETFPKTADKENQSPSFDTIAFQKQLKNYIIENFISSRPRGLRDIAQNVDTNIDSNEVHLHHHEHHHHYYFDNASATDACTWPPPVREYIDEAKHNWDKPSEEEESKTNYCKCQTKEKFCQNYIPETISKSSTDGNTDRLSDILQSHDYSETDLKKRESVEGDDQQDQNSMKNLQQSYNALMNSLKSFNDFTSPLVITNQKTKPKISFVRCECTSNISLDLTAEITAETTEGETEDTRSEMTIFKRISKPRNSNQGKPAFENLSTSDDTSSEIIFQTRRLENELRRLKRDLKFIEDKEMKKTSVFGKLSSFNNKINDQRHIRVYSSKTFIFHLNKMCDCSQREELTEERSLSCM